MLMASFLKRLFKRKKKLPEELQLRFLKRMHRFLSNGYPLQDTLEAIAWDKDLQPLSNSFLERLKQGLKLDDIFERSGFHPSIHAFLSFVHANSNLIDAIGKCTEITEQRFKNMKKFKVTIRYPFMLLILFSIILFFINHQILPSFQSLLQSSTQALTTVTILKLLLDLFQFIVLILALLILTLYFTWKKVRKNIPIEEQLKFLRRIPIYYRYLRIQTSFQFATHFSSLLKAGLSLKEILYELEQQQRLPILSYYAQLLTNNLKRGFHISYFLEELPFIENQLAAIFQKNANIKMLEKDLTLYSDLLLEEMERIIIQTITFIQPIFYIVLGVFIIFIYISLMWPMFQLINTF